jgi:proline-specific peptidase
MSQEPKTPIKEGFVSFRDYKTWYRIVGDKEKPGKLPLICLHGGPGATWDYLEPLEAIAHTGRRVIFYDQLGSGNSDEPHNPSMYTVELYVEELDVVRRALGLKRVNILGQSWGGMLAMEYALTQPKGLAGLILANTAASLPDWAREAQRLVAELPLEVQQTLQQHLEAGTTNSAEYRTAYEVFSQRHILSLEPKPDCWTRRVNKPGGEVYETMWGPSEVHITGTLKDWDITSRLGELNFPTLVLCGRNDEATPFLSETLHRGIHDSELVIFENSEHIPHISETERYLQVLDAFLNRVETNLDQNPSSNLTFDT